jgi:cell division protein FtsB
VIEDPGTQRARRRATPRTPPLRPKRHVRRFVQLALVVLGVTLMIESFFGSRGLAALFDARRQHAALSADLERLRAENARLRANAQRLREDPRAIEEAARRDLGYSAPGEKVFIIKDVRPAPTPPQPPAQK